MLLRILSSALSIGLILSACKTTKKTQSNNDVATIQLDTISVNAPGPSKQEIYRASNTRDNDIIHTRLEVSFDWAQSRMNGKATIEVKPYFYPTNILYLNARGMEIKKLDVLTPRAETSTQQKAADEAAAEASDGNMGRSPYTYKNDSIKVNLGRMISAQEIYTVVIEYVAKPNELKAAGGSNAITDDKGLYFINPTGENPLKMPQIWTQGETQSNSVWFPTIDSPNEKMTQEILMRVDNKYTTLSNGSLISSAKQADGTRIDHWKLDQPHSTYLAMMAVGEFKKVTDTPWKDREISYYVEPLYEADAKGIFGDTKEMIEFYSNVLGVPYAWPKYSQIVARDYVSGAMENTSATLHGDFMVYQTTREMLDGKKGNSVIAHELFHQWFGDLVTSESWSNLSLNESFATYGEYLWDEHKSGRDAADYHHWQSKQGYLNSSKEVNLIRFNYNDKEDMFDAFSYNKGGQILHMLRKAVGDKAFFASLKNYLETNKYKPAEVHNLRLAFEETTGRDMNWFFNQWYLNKGRPSLKITKKTSKALDTLMLTIEQVQDLKKFPQYTLPLEVDIYKDGAVKRKHIVISEQKQTFIWTINGAPDLVNFDAERQLLADIDYPKTQAEYVFQAENAPLFEDRLEALKALESKISEDRVYNLFKQLVEKDKIPQIRYYAIQQLEKVGPAQKEDVKSVFLRFFMSEKNTVTRTKFLAALNRMFPGSSEMEGLNISALKEESYAICTEALNGLAKSNPKLAVEKAGLFERETGKDILFAVATIYASNGGDGQLHFFHGALKYINGFDVIGFGALYAKTARQCKIPENAIMAAKDLEMMGKGASKYIKFTTVKGLSDILSTWTSIENSTQIKLDAARKDSKNTAELEKELKTAQATKATLQEIYSRSK